jgi:hypothetical protein
MVTPTTRIYKWFLKQNTEVQNELSAVICPLHCDAMIKMAADDVTAVTRLLVYLRTDGLPFSEVISRALISRTLIDYAISIKAMPVYWRKIKKGAEMVMHHGELAGMPDNAKDEFKKLLAVRRKCWKSACRSWALLKTRYLCCERIAAFEQEALLWAIKNGVTTPYGKMDGQRPTECIMHLWGKPEALISFIYMRALVAGASKSHTPPYLAAPYSLHILGQVENN